MPAVHEEIELKYDIDETFEVPPLLSLSGPFHEGLPVTSGEPTTHRLEATYFDTVDQRLAKARLTLRRRTGGADAGWHLKVPGVGGSRQEVRVALGRSRTTVPQALQSLVRAVSGGRPLIPVASIVTERTERRLLDPTGQVLVEVADDRVDAKRLFAASSKGTHSNGAGSNGAASDAAASNSAPTPEPTLTWRELEVELYATGRDLLDKIDEQLRQLGVRPAGSASKVARVLNGAAAAAVPGPEGAPAAPTAGDVVLRYVREQVSTIITSDPQVRLDIPDSIHRMRVATRRLRSALQTFTPVLSTEVTRPMRAELTWLAAELGSARDAEVLRERLLAAVEGQDHGGAVQRTVDAETSAAYRQAHDSLLAVLDSDRYHELVRRLDELASAPPMTTKASRPASKVLPARAARAYAALSELVDTAHSATAGEARDHALHEARKAAKKARYAGEALKNVFGDPAARFASAMESVQEELGEHQDSVVLRERLEQLAAAETNPAAAYSFGRLHAFEEVRGDRALERFEVAWRSANKKSLRRWLR